MHLHSLADGRTRTIASYDYAHIGTPRVSDDYVAWTVREPCDASGTPPRDVGTGAFLFGIENEVTRQLTGYPEPDVLLDGKTAVVHEGCWLPRIGPLQLSSTERPPCSHASLPIPSHSQCQFWNHPGVQIQREHRLNRDVAKR